MNKGEIFKDKLKGEKSYLSNYFIKSSSLRHHQGGIIIKWLCIYLGLSFFLCSVVPVEAGQVYGRVYDKEGKFPPGGFFTLTDKNEKSYPVKTDKYRGYSIIIPEGIYKVNYQANNNQSFEAWIKSFQNSVRQDIYLNPTKSQ